MNDRYKVVAIAQNWAEHILVETDDYDFALETWTRFSKSKKWQSVNIVDTQADLSDSAR